jgi:hypothetical protein
MPNARSITVRGESGNQKQADCQFKSVGTAVRTDRGEGSYLPVKSKEPASQALR